MKKENKMNQIVMFDEIKANETFRFMCQNCGDCCRNVKSTVMVESLDLFCIARHFNLDMTEAAEQFTEVAAVGWGAPILLMKANLNEDCIFYKNNRCEIQSVKPRACRLYPLSMGPEDREAKNFIILKSQERQFHYTGKEHIAGEWVAENMNGESYAYVTTEYRQLRELGRILNRIPREKEDEVLGKMLLYRFFMFNTSESFMPQYVRNMALLKAELERMII
jgi:Fe-S-cluster containining protein